MFQPNKGSSQSHTRQNLTALTSTRYSAQTNGSPSNHKPALTIMSINIEGFSSDKSQLLANMCQDSGCDVICVQETHRSSEQQRPIIPGMTLVAEIPHERYGSAVFVRSNIAIYSTACRSDDLIEIITIDTGNCTVTSVYKPPKQSFKFRHTTNFNDRNIKIVIGDFNSHSTTWGYNATNTDGAAVEEWAEVENLTLIHNAKLPASFNSRVWSRGYNPDLIFASANIGPLCRKYIYQPIPKTQHRPIVCCVESAVKPQIVPFRPRFNFLKANWELFSRSIDSKLQDIKPEANKYDQFIEIVRTVSRQHIPRGCRTEYVPGLSKESSALLTEYQALYDRDPFSEETIEAGEELMHIIGESRKDKWMSLVTNINMTHNSKKAWQTIKKLTDDPPLPKNPGPVTSNQIAHQLLLNGKPPHRLPRMKKLEQTNTPSSTEISKPFTLTELIIGIKSLQNGKATGFDDLTVEQIKHLGPVAISWLLALFNDCLQSTKIPKIWRRAKVIALLKPGKSPNDPKSYRPISLLCHTFKLFERLLLNRLTPLIEPYLIPEQAGFRPGKSCSNQTLKLTQFIEDGFEENKITGVVFVDLSAAYDTVNISRLLTKAHHITNDPGFVHILSKILNNRRFQVFLNNDKSRWRNQRNGLPQGSVLAPALFNIYTNDQPSTLCTQRFIYADDLALAAQTHSFEQAEENLTAALETLGSFYDENALRPNPTKTESCTFHLRNRQSNRTLDIVWRGVNIEHNNYPRYLGITLDRALTYKPHCLKVKQKVGTRNNLLRRLTSTSWGASPEVLRTTGLSLSFSAGEFACPVWHRSAHAKMADVALNETCRIITGCLKPTPLKLLYPLAGIAPPEVRREIACSIDKRRQETDSRHPLYGYRIPPVRLKSRKSFLRLTSPTEKSATAARCELWESSASASFIAPAEHLPPGRELQWPTWKSLNRLRTKVGRCRENLAKWGFRDPSQVQCDCGAPVQDMAHLLVCPLCPTSCTQEDLLRATEDGVRVASYWEKVI